MADQRMYANKRGGRRSSGETVHQVLLRVAAEHDGELRDHVDDVAELVERVGRELASATPSSLEVRRAAALHDIGKVAIPDAILQAPRALTPTSGNTCASTRHRRAHHRRRARLPGVARIVRSSHERYDGGGYPDGLAGDEIPLGARIVAVCDAYDAMVTDRAYRMVVPPARRSRSSALRRQAVRPPVVAGFIAATANDFASHECAVARKGSIERALDVIELVHVRPIPGTTTLRRPRRRSWVANRDHEGDVGPEVAQREERLSGLPGPGALRRRLLRRVPAVRPARARPRPHGRGRPHGHPRRRVGLVDVGARGRALRARLARSPCSTARTRAASSVVLGTPTYAMPPWLVRKYPEVSGRARAPGGAIPYGHRQDADYSHPAFRWHAERITRKVVGRYADHPAVIGYQVDNEPGIELFHNRGAFQGFVDRCASSYGDVETLNERWGLVYWSHRIARWDELWTPDGNTVPSYDLAWRRYQSALTTDFIAEQAASCASSRGRTSSSRRAWRSTGPAFDPRRPQPRARHRGGQPLLPDAGRAHDARPPPDAARAGALDRGPGAWAIHLQADITRGARDQPFLVTETNAISIGESHANFPAYDGQWRQAAWALVARGARMVEYWHWHSIHFGHETYWLGVLNHDGEPGRCYAEVAADRRRVRARRGRGGRPRAGRRRRRCSTRRESKWAMEFHPPLAAEGGIAPDRDSYERILGRFYEGLFGAGLQADDRLPAGPRRRRRGARRPLARARGARRCTSPTTRCSTGSTPTRAPAATSSSASARGYADEEARPRHEVMPGRLREAVGATYSEYTNLTVPVPVAARRPRAAGGRGGDRMGRRARPRGRRDAASATSTRTSAAGPP